MRFRKVRQPSLLPAPSRGWSGGCVDGWGDSEVDLQGCRPNAPTRTRGRALSRPPRLLPPRPSLRDDSFGVFWDQDRAVAEEHRAGAVAQVDGGAWAKPARNQGLKNWDPTLS